MTFSETHDDQRLQDLSYQSVSSLDTGSEVVLLSYSKNCIIMCQVPAETQTLHFSKEEAWASGTVVPPSWLA